MNRRNLVTVERWIARILGTLFLLLFVTFAIGEGLPPIWREPPGVQLEFLGMFLVLAGIVAGWRWDGRAAILILAGYGLFYSVERRLPWPVGPFDFMLAVGVLFGLCWWQERKRQGATANRIRAKPNPDGNAELRLTNEAERRTSRRGTTV
jgi:hypothetical protein